MFKPSHWKCIFALKQEIIDILIKISRSNLMNQVHNIDFAEQYHGLLKPHLVYRNTYFEP